MCFRGGGIGHKETWEWNKILFSDVGKLVDDEDADSETEEVSGKNPKGEEGQEEEAEAEEDGKGNGNRNRNSARFGDEEDELKAWRQVMQDPQHNNDDNESDKSAKENPDHIIPDEGDDDIYTYKGYGAL